MTEPLKRRDKVTCVSDDAVLGRVVVWQGRVLALGKHTFRSGAPAASKRAAYNLDDEGVTWCRGWGGEAAKALRVTVALT